MSGDCRHPEPRRTASSAQTAERTAIVARDRVIDAFRTELRVAVTVERRFTAEQISAASGVAVRALRTYMANDPTEVREPPTSAMLSIAVVLGTKTVNVVLALIGYGGAEPLDEPDELRPMELVADAMSEIAVIGQIACKVGINHQNRDEVRKAADQIIHDMLPLASAGGAE